MNEPYWYGRRAWRRLPIEKQRYLEERGVTKPPHPLKRIARGVGIGAGVYVYLLFGAVCMAVVVTVLQACAS